MTSNLRRGSILSGSPDVVRYAQNEDGSRNICLQWPSGARVMVVSTSADPEAVVIALTDRRCALMSDDGVIRFDERGLPWLLHRRDRGWGERGYCHESLDALLHYWAIEALAPAQDEHGIYLPTRRAAP